MKKTQSKAPNFHFKFVPTEKDDKSTHLHRQLIGYLGASLPVLVWIVSAWRPTPQLPLWRPLESISAYYYSGGVAIFTGILACLAVFFFTYKGYQNKDQWRDRLTAYVAATAALGVAFFPTGAPDAALEPKWWMTWMKWIHYGSAMVLFSSFIYFCLALFPMAKPGSRVLDPDKLRRNNVYRICGWIMVACVLSVPILGFLARPIYYSETFALWAFAYSWLEKGRAWDSIPPAVERLVHFTRHPAVAVKHAWGNFKVPK